MRDEYDFKDGKRGPVKTSTGKTRITIMLDDDVLDAFRALAEREGSGYQTLINAALRDALRSPGNKTLTVATLRRVLREELRSA